MGNRYKRIVTLAMVGITVLLAWIYCMFMYRTQPIYIAGASVLVVGSLYIFLMALVDLKITKEDATKDYVSECMKDLVASMKESKDYEELERLGKASYVQQRNTNTQLAKQTEELSALMADIMKTQLMCQEGITQHLEQVMNKATKIVVKYNQNNSDKQFSATKELSADVVEEIASVAAAVLQVNDEVKRMQQQLEMLQNQIARMEGLPKQVEELIKVEKEQKVVVESTNETVVQEPAQEDTNVSKWLDEMDIVNEISPEPDDAEVEVQEAVMEDHEHIEEPPQLQIQGIIATDAESKVEIKSTDEKESMNPDLVAELFEESKETHRANSMDDFKVHEHPDAMDQSLIDALLGNIGESDDTLEVHRIDEQVVQQIEQQNEELADVIPFPQMEVAEETEPVAQPEPEAVVEPEPVVDDDPNRQMTPEEIAALFAAAQGHAEELEAQEEPVEQVQPEPQPVVEDDPNRQMTPDEIAALFAAAQGHAEELEAQEEPVEQVQPEPQPVADENPNRQLTPDEIAALFASAQ
ncbi:MAG: hypothetical protein ACI4EK_05170 [Wujia sp.]